MNIPATKVQALIQSIFVSAGCKLGEAEAVARRLVGANLVGHDSHGAIQVPNYTKWTQAGKVVPNQVDLDRRRQRCARDH